MSLILVIGALTAVGRGLYSDLTAVVEQPRDPASDPQAGEAATPLEAEIRELDVGLGFTGSGLAAAAAGVIVKAPIGMLALPCLLVPLERFAGHAWADARAKRKLSFAVLEFCGLVTALAAGHMVLCVLGLTIYQAGRRGLLATRRRTRDDLGEALDDWAERVWVIRDGVEVEIELAQLEVADHIVISAGQTLPCDGVLVSGSLAVDEHMLTGESMLVEKAPGDSVLGMTLVLSGRGVMEAQRTGAETMAARLADLIVRTESHEQRVEIRSEQLADSTALPTTGAGIVGLVVGGINGAAAGIWANCVDSLWLSAPISAVGLMRAGARHGIMIRDGRSLDLLADIDTVVFDKTGTLTLGTMTVAWLYPAEGRDRAELLRFAAGAERRQNHPIALAILAAARAEGLCPSTLEVGVPTYETGLGLRIEVEGAQVLLGSRKLLERAGISISPEIVERQAAAGALGHTTVCLAIDGEYAGLIELEPQLRPEAEAAVSALQARGLDTLILSGDDEAPTRALASALGIDRWHAQMLPEDKRDLILALRSEGRRVCFVGDGINDALAMRHCEVSISLTGASAIALDSAQIVLSDGRLSGITAALELGERSQTATRRIYRATVIPSFAGVGGVLVAGLGPVAMFGVYLVSQSITMGVALRSMRWAPSTALDDPTPPRS
ncbi:heavy metal translocating P-type ATPase [Enhygromyxa salina]|uniref:Copper-transporting P-type ATPase n=1 Tax=Enhygromyxa salina TaxID=215803 RepID=A0A2S9YTL2_9BACT|nr:heavy metal translocating P-type ATPase [Enhygromyxa salina]PRQ08455.1 Copper-transporting P-type ATPase [Enhygromyxa salina]